MAVLSPRALRYPFTAEQILPLAAGQFVTVSGMLFTARDRIHKFLFDGGKCPVTLKDGGIYHCGPVTIRQDGAWTVRAAGPTTSAREEPYLPRIIKQHGVRVVLGKGAMGPRMEAACVENGCVYLHAVGGAAQVLAGKVVAVKGVHFTREFGLAEAMWELEVSEFPAIVAIDARGRSLLKRVQTISRRHLKRAVEDGDRFET
jgi:tartrate/fumarate subfamily iron-sulfur-dependent hydro-lyase beta chain